MDTALSASLKFYLPTIFSGGFKITENAVAFVVNICIYVLSCPVYEVGVDERVPGIILHSPQL